MNAFFFALILGIILLPSMLSSAYAEVEKGKNFDRELVSINPDGSKTYNWASHPERIVTGYEWSGKPIYSDYRLTETADSVFLETANSGSYHFNKLECSYNFYEAGYIELQNPPKVRNISWDVKGKANSSSTWNSVAVINNADCVVSLQTTEETVKLTAEKSANVGKFQIVLDYSPGEGIKETMRAFNNNPAWNNHNIGFVETFDIPQTIRFGGNLFDLSEYNGTILGRTWIENNNAKLVKLSDRVFYDFGIGFENLDHIRILWDGSQASLELSYLFDHDVVLYQQWVEVDPTFGYTTGIKNAANMAGSVAATCSTTGSNIARAETSTVLYKEASAAGTSPSCIATAFEYDISSLPSNLVAVTNVNFRADFNTVTNGINCDYGTVTSVQPSTLASSAANAKTLFDAIIAGSDYISNDPACTADSTDNVFDLGAQADTDVEAQLAAGWYAVTVTFDSYARDASAHYFIIDTTDAELEITYTLPPVPYAVTDLTAEEITSVSALLSWTEPFDNGSPIIGYQVNKSTGGGDPQTVVENDTGTTDTAYIVTGLTDATNSFRVGAWNSFGLNASGNTATLQGVSFQIGQINVTESNPDLVGIRFERTDVNDTASFVNVTYSDLYNLACDLHYVYAQTNQTYMNLDNVTIDDNFVESSFLFLDPGNEVVEITCWDQNTNDTGRYVLTQTDFLLLQQIRDFRAGEFGTSGMFGIIDMVTLVVVILAMIGFNRLSESVGAIFNSIMLGVLGYFEIIDFPIIFFGALAIVIMLAIFSTRKD